MRLYLILQELPELSRGDLATGRVTSIPVTSARVVTPAEKYAAVEAGYPGFKVYGPVGESVKGGAPFIAVNVYLSKSRDGHGRVAGNMEVWRVAPEASARANPPPGSRKERLGLRNHKAYVEDDDVYLGTLLNPKDHKPYGIVWSKSDQNVQVILPTGEERYEVVGRGHYGSGDYDDDGEIMSATGCPRTHTPSGVSKKGAGLGLMLYSGLALGAAYASAIGSQRARKLRLPTGTQACVASPEGGRSGDASRWWRRQVENGFAETETIESSETEDECEDGRYDIEMDALDYLGGRRDAERHIEDYIGGDVTNVEITGQRDLEGWVEYTFCKPSEGGGEIEVNILRADKVLAAGFVVDVNPEIDEKVGGPQVDLDVALEADLTEVSDWGFINAYMEWLADIGATGAQIVKFRRERIPFWLSSEGELTEKQAFKRFARNPQEDELFAAMRARTKAQDAAKMRRLREMKKASAALRRGDQRAYDDIYRDAEYNYELEWRAAEDAYREVFRRVTGQKNPPEPPPLGMKVRRARDFAETGNWVVEYVGRTMTIFFDRDNAAWYTKLARREESAAWGFKDYQFLGHSKPEALKRVAAMMGGTGSKNPEPILARLRRLVAEEPDRAWALLGMPPESAAITVEGVRQAGAGYEIVLGLDVKESPIVRRRVEQRMAAKKRSGIRPATETGWSFGKLVYAVPVTLDQYEALDRGLGNPGSFGRDADGKYAYTSGWDRLCVCGHKLEDHAPSEKYCRECDCKKMRASRKKLPKKNPEVEHSEKWRAKFAQFLDEADPL